MDLQGKVAIVTGGASGIGKVMVLRLASLGVKVVIGDMNTEQGTQTVAEVATAGGEADFFKVDVANQVEVAALITRAKSHFGRLDILHNNAGITTVSGEFATADLNRAEAVIRTNLFGTMVVSQAALPSLTETKGVIVNTASVSGLRPWPIDPVYSASKAGVVFFTRTLARQLKETGVRCNCVCPGLVNTPMFDESTQALKLSDEQREGLRTMALTPAEVVDVLIELIENESLNGEARYVGKQPLPEEGRMLKAIP